MGVPLASMMTVENPETFDEVICVAPAERQKPLSIMSDSNFEAMSKLTWKIFQIDLGGGDI